MSTSLSYLCQHLYLTCVNNLIEPGNASILPVSAYILPVNIFILPVNISILPVNIFILPAKSLSYLSKPLSYLSTPLLFLSTFYLICTYFYCTKYNWDRAQVKRPPSSIPVIHANFPNLAGIIPILLTAKRHSQFPDRDS